METIAASGNYLNVFEDVPGIKAFFATKSGAREGWPYRNDEVFKEVGADKLVKVGHHQTHTTDVIVVDEEMVKNAEDGWILSESTDGAITNVPGVLLTSMHADCIPLFFYDPTLRVIGMIHSGWKGTAGEIGRVTVELMQKTYGCNPEDILAHIGPGISKCCFEIDEDVFNQFKDPEYTTDGDKYYVDLKAYNRRMLMNAGLKEENITVSDHCTCCEPDLFASFRYDGTQIRMGGGIYML